MATVLLLTAFPLTASSSDDSDAPDASPGPDTSTGPGATGPTQRPASSGQSSDDHLGRGGAGIEHRRRLRVTPPLGLPFGAGHATTSRGLTALAENDLELSAGNAVGSDFYDEADADFSSLQGPPGAFATYDTSPMSLFETGESGGCPWRPPTRLHPPEVRVTR